MRRLLPLALALLVPACGEDEPAPEPNLPKVTAAEAICRQIGDTFFLESFTATVRDLDGVETLATARAIVETVSLPLTEEDQDWVVSDTVECGAERCDRVFSFIRPPTAEPQIYCGEDGKLLTVAFTVEDEEGFPDKVLVPTKPLQ